MYVLCIHRYTQSRVHNNRGKKMNKQHAQQLGTAIGWCAVAIGAAMVFPPFVKLIVYTLCTLWGVA